MGAVGERQKPRLAEHGADRTLDAEVAIRLFGWRWFLNPRRLRVNLQPPDDGVWERWGFPIDAVDVTGREGEYERFVDWDNACSRGERGPRGLPHYSNEIAAAWEIVEHLRGRGFDVQIKHPGGNGEWLAVFSEDACEWDASLPLAICRAALKAIATETPAR